ncbi:substrate-binding periplasmic protein [Millisia brevis]|uniref:substrate-binding periplasmic protein n=1 Tax=Millisia brevis TaxID=264148 RepID=UPI00082C4F02|nr:ABC transporter substrate-binding protein [Millisia brevis]
MTSELRVICADISALPLFEKAAPDGTRVGYEPSAAELVAERMGRTVRWVYTAWSDMVPAVLDGRGDVLWCGQGITDARKEIVDFTRPYGIFDESLLVRADSGITSIEDVAGKRIGAIAGSTNMTLTETFPGVIAVPFGGTTDDVFGEMIQALRDGSIDGFVDDDVALVPVGDEPDLAVAFTVATRNKWGACVAPGNDALLAELDAALTSVIADGSLQSQWDKWMPTLAFPLTVED